MKMHNWKFKSVEIVEGNIELKFENQLLKKQALKFFKETSEKNKNFNIKVLMERLRRQFSRQSSSNFDILIRARENI